jgi:hypothetical protein
MRQELSRPRFWMVFQKPWERVTRAERLMVVLAEAVTGAKCARSFLWLTDTLLCMAMAGCAAMTMPSQQAPQAPETSRMSTRGASSPSSPCFCAVRLGRHLRFARDLRHRRRLKLAFTVLVLLRQLRKS